MLWAQLASLMPRGAAWVGFQLQDCTICAQHWPPWCPQMVTGVFWHRPHPNFTQVVLSPKKFCQHHPSWHLQELRHRGGHCLQHRTLHSHHDQSNQFVPVL